MRSAGRKNFPWLNADDAEANDLGDGKLPPPSRLHRHRGLVIENYLPEPPLVEDCGDLFDDEPLEVEPVASDPEEPLAELPPVMPEPDDPLDESPEVPDAPEPLEVPE